MSVPFEDPERVYDDVRRIIEATASSLDINLSRLKQEATSPTGGAQKAKSTYTRFQSLVLRASQEERARAVQTQTVATSSVQTQLLGGVALSTDVTFDMSEICVDAELLSSPEMQPTGPGSPPSHNKPNLGFRVWDSDSRTRYTEMGFVSKAYALWRREPIPPFDLNTKDGQRA